MHSPSILAAVAVAPAVQHPQVVQVRGRAEGRVCFGWKAFLYCFGCFGGEGVAGRGRRAWAGDAARLEVKNPTPLENNVNSLALCPAYILYTTKTFNPVAQYTSHPTH
eukprot:scaffold251620_cov18-Tisochrysis_lutea.AAC.1